MKKFLKKKPVMITFIVLAVLMLVFYIGMMVRPVAWWMDYSYKGEKVTQTITFNNDKSLKTKMKSENSTYENAYSVYVKEGYLFLVGDKDMSKDDYNEATKAIDDTFAVSKSSAVATEVNAFSMKVGDQKYVCVGQYVFAVVGAIVEVALLGFAVTSVILSVKKK
ncbi:MAG: hypothetical protein E7351_01880 [Clostridiales bacterium]|nr:hypothetical protein [Clostridiales bacterium]